jgi:hypothetical protein
MMAGVPCQYCFREYTIKTGTRQVFRAKFSRLSPHPRHARVSALSGSRQAGGRKQIILLTETTCFADGINLFPRAKQVDSTGKESGFPAPLEGCLGELALFLMWCEVFFTFFANFSSGVKKVSDKG